MKGCLFQEKSFASSFCPFLDLRTCYIVPIYTYNVTHFWKICFEHSPLNLTVWCTCSILKSIPNAVTVVCRTRKTRRQQKVKWEIHQQHDIKIKLFINRTQKFILTDFNWIFLTMLAIKTVFHLITSLFYVPATKFFLLRTIINIYVNVISLTVPFTFSV